MGFVVGLLSGVPNMSDLKEVTAQLQAVNDNLERIADDLDTILAGVTYETLKGLGKGILSFLEGVLDKAEITNGTEGKDQCLK